MTHEDKMHTKIDFFSPMESSSFPFFFLSQKITPKTFRKTLIYLVLCIFPKTPVELFVKKKRIISMKFSSESSLPSAPGTYGWLIFGEGCWRVRESVRHRRYLSVYPFVCLSQLEGGFGWISKEEMTQGALTIDWWVTEWEASSSLGYHPNLLSRDESLRQSFRLYQASPSTTKFSVYRLGLTRLSHGW